jgi:glutathione synthase/RimK-type ligase-like ATP-grasp enzyme
MPNRRIALVMGADNPPDPDLLDVQAILRQRGYEVDLPVWNDAGIAWESFDVIVIRSTWGYYRHYQAYRDWLIFLKSLRRVVLNSPNLILWNLDKASYLAELNRNGVAIIPTCHLKNWDEKKIEAFAEAHPSAQYVIKPAVSASAFRTHKVEAQHLISAGKIVAEEILNSSPVLIQPLISEINISGELSMIFIQGKYSHSIVKHPHKNDFRVQVAHGGTFRSAAPDAETLAIAERIMKHLPEAPLYARVDGIITGAGFVLMELELNEPYLFLSSDSDARQRFVEAIESFC